MTGAVHPLLCSFCYSDFYKLHPSSTAYLMMLNYLQGWMDHLQVHMHMNPHLLVKDSNLQKPQIQQYLSNILLQWNL